MIIYNKRLTPSQKLIYLILLDKGPLTRKQLCLYYNHHLSVNQLSAMSVKLKALMLEGYIKRKKFPTGYIYRIIKND